MSKETIALKQMMEMVYSILVILETMDVDKTITTIYITSARQNISNAIDTV